MKARAASPLRQIRLAMSTEEVARRLSRLPGLVWLDSSDSRGGASRSLLTALPERILCGRLPEVSTLRSWLQGAAPAAADLSLPLGGLFGSVDFDGSYRFGCHRHVLFHDTATDQWWEHGELSRWLPELPPRRRPPPVEFAPCADSAVFLEGVRRALDYIAAGDIYQVNLSRQFAAAWPADASPMDYYLQLRHFSPAPQAAWLDQGRRQVLSASPELFLRLSGSSVLTRPIKGTRPRRRDPQEDERSAYELLTSAKELAELIMITDLERNDLGKVCEFGSVRVPEMMKLERFQQVFHLVSTVQGTLRPGCDHLDVLCACFPGGSISGAPKKRALEIIAELEPVPRGLYTGAIGYLGPNGESQFSIAIRTAVAEGDTLHFHAGAGIVADSDPQRECEETWHKASSLIGAATWQPD